MNFSRFDAARTLATCWRLLGVVALLAPLVLLGLDLARALGALTLAAALMLAALPVGPSWARMALTAGPLAAALVLLLHALEGWISPPTALMGLFAWAAVAKAALAAVCGSRWKAALALPLVVSVALVSALASGWACGHFWLLATFLGIELLADATALSPAAPPPG